MWTAASEPTGMTWRTSTPSCSWASSTPSWSPTLLWPGCTSSSSSWAAWCTPWPTWGSCGRPPAPWPTWWPRSPVPPWPCRLSGKRPATCDQPLTPRPPDRWPPATWARPGRTWGTGHPFKIGIGPRAWFPSNLLSVGSWPSWPVCVHTCECVSLGFLGEVEDAWNRLETGRQG